MKVAGAASALVVALRTADEVMVLVTVESVVAVAAAVVAGPSQSLMPVSCQSTCFCRL